MKRTPKQVNNQPAEQALKQSNVQPYHLRKIGLITGVNYRAGEYYRRLINQQLHELCGDWTTAPLISSELNFAEIRQLKEVGDWESIGRLICRAADEVYLGNAEALVICDNCAHRYINQLTLRHPTMSVLPLAQAVAPVVKQMGLHRLGFLDATEVASHRNAIFDYANWYGTTIYHPDDQDSRWLNRTIEPGYLDQLHFGDNVEASRAMIDEVLAGLVHDTQVQGVILGCTELEKCYDHARQDAWRQQMHLPDFQFLDAVSLHAAAIANFVYTGEYTVPHAKK